MSPDSTCRLTGTVLTPLVRMCGGAWDMTWKESGSVVRRKILTT